MFILMFGFFAVVAGLAINKDTDIFINSISKMDTNSTDVIFTPKYETLKESWSLSSLKNSMIFGGYLEGILIENERERCVDEFYATLGKLLEEDKEKVLYSPNEIAAQLARSPDEYWKIINGQEKYENLFFPLYNYNERYFPIIELNEGFKYVALIKFIDHLNNDIENLNNATYLKISKNNVNNIYDYLVRINDHLQNVNDHPNFFNLNMIKSNLSDLNFLMKNVLKNNAINSAKVYQQDLVFSNKVSLQKDKVNQFSIVSTLFTQKSIIRDTLNIVCFISSSLKEFFDLTNYIEEFTQDTTIPNIDKKFNYFNKSIEKCELQELEKKIIKDNLNIIFHVANLDTEKWCNYKQFTETSTMVVNLESDTFLFQCYTSPLCKMSFPRLNYLFGPAELSAKYSSCLDPFKLKKMNHEILVIQNITGYFNSIILRQDLQTLSTYKLFHDYYKNYTYMSNVCLKINYAKSMEHLLELIPNKQCYKDYINCLVTIKIDLIKLYSIYMFEIKKVQKVTDSSLELSRNYINEQLNSSINLKRLYEKQPELSIKDIKDIKIATRIIKSSFNDKVVLSKKLFVGKNLVDNMRFLLLTRNFDSSVYLKTSLPAWERELLRVVFTWSHKYEHIPFLFN